MHIDFTMTTMPGFADMLTQLMTQLGGANGGRQIVDMTGIKGNYDATLEISLAEIIALARAQGADIPQGPPPAAAPNNAAPTASDPSGGGTSLTDAVQAMGLKLESRKAVVDQFVVDHIEKTPTEN
jgi:uncharacterized protein (TIGR03435 family)